MQQLPFDFFEYVRNYKPCKGPYCPCCKQKINTRIGLFTSWLNLREWLLANWNWAAKVLVLHQKESDSLSLKEHPDLLWALEAEAAWNDLELDDLLAEIVDGYFQGKYNALKRRGKRLPPLDDLKNSTEKDCSLK
jgi:hypothetical protein